MFSDASSRGREQLLHDMGTILVILLKTILVILLKTFSSKPNGNQA